jgi:hypothetical protein
MQTQTYRPPAISSAPVTTALTMLSAVILSGCASQVSIDSTRQGDARSEPFKRVMVVAVSPDIDQRCAFEHVLAGRMQSETTEAFSSCSAMGKNKEPMTREAIEQAIAATQAEAVLATSLVDKAWGAEEGGSRETRGDAYYKATDMGYATGYYGAYGVPVIYGEFQTASTLTTMQGAVRITSKLFETRGATVVYTMDTVAHDLEGRDSSLATLTEPMAERLRRDGLIK